MKVDVYDITKTKTGDVKLPSQFSEEYRPDLILRAVLAKQSHDRQPYAGAPLAGKRSSAKLSRRRKDYRGSYGIGISRVPRKIMSRAGTRMNWVGAFMPGTVGGRRAHPPKAEKDWNQKINESERKKAIRSAISATTSKEIVELRGHIIPQHYPFILDDKFESLNKTKTAFDALVALGLEKELTRVEDKKVRAGKGKMRGRKYRSKKGPLVVVSKNDKLVKAVSNIPGIDVVDVKSLNAELLAPGGVAGRLTLFTKSAVAEMEKQNLYK